MKKRLFFAALLAAMFLAVPAQAQFRFGIKAGANVSALAVTTSLSESLTETFNSDNIVSFTAGVMGEYIAPFGLGVDFGALYTRKGSELDMIFDTKVAHIDYVEIPLNLKYRLAIPAINNVVMPFVFAGPSFAIRVSDNLEDYKAMFKSKDFDIALNVGLGLELFNHLQISGQYGWGLGKALTVMDTKYTDALANAKSRAWTITAAYYF